MKKLYIVATVIMIALLTVFCFADGIEGTRLMSYSVDGYAGDETRLFSPDDSPGRGIYKFDLPEEAWSISGEAESVKYREYDAIAMGCVFMQNSYDGGDGMTLTMDLSHSGAMADEYVSLGFGIGVVGGYEECDAYTVETELITDEGVYRSSLRIGKDDELYYWSIVYTDITEVKGSVKRLSVTVKFDGDTMPDQIRVSTPFMSVRTYSGFETASKYLAASMKNVAGRFVGATGAVIPTEDNTADFRGTIVSDKPLEENSTVYFRITLDGLYSGRMTFGINYTDPNKKPAYRSEKIQVNGESSFIIPVTLMGEAYEYFFRFENVECDRTFKITSVTLESDGRSEFLPDETVGALDSIQRNGNSIKFSGTINRDAAKKYSGASIVFYALTNEYTDSLSDAVEIGRIKVSTRFEYTADLTTYAASADTYMFMAALYSGGRIIPISYPAYCDPATLGDEFTSNIGLSGAAAAGAFESNVSHIIVDIPLSELMSVADGERSLPLSYTVYGGEENGQVKTKSLNRAVLEELDRDINFYISVGMRVYLRLTFSSPIDGLTSGGGEGEEIIVTLDSPESIAMYASVVRFFSQRYSSIGGFVVGKDANGALFRSMEGDGVLQYAQNLATLCTVTYNTVSNYHRGARVIVPFGVTENEAERLSDELLLSILSDRLDSVGGIPWTLMYCIDKATENVPELCNLTDKLSLTKIPVTNSVMYLYRPLLGETMIEYIKKNNGDISNVNEFTYIRYTAELFSWVCDMLGDSGVVFMEFDDTPVKTSREFYSALKVKAESDGSIFDSAAEKTVLDYTGSVYSIWDFSDKYHTEGWLGGGGVASCLTDYSDVVGSSDRVLKTQLAGDGYGGAGIVLGNFEKTVDLSAADSLRFTFALTGDGITGSSNVSVVFVVGSSDHRAEYYAEGVVCGEMTSYVCDLSGYSGKTESDYIGVMIYADDDVCFELASVEALSSTTDEETLRLVFEGSGSEASITEEDKALALAAVIVVAAISAVVVIMLVRRDREDREEAEKAKAAAESKNKRSYYEKHR